MSFARAARSLCRSLVRARAHRLYLSSSSLSPMEHVTLTTPAAGVLVVELNRPKALNALSDALMKDLGVALAHAQQDQAVGAVVITGNDKAFAAGADVKELAREHANREDCVKKACLKTWYDAMGATSKPKIAAVRGYAFGGGCELALACDIVIAAENAQFGLPELSLGTIPGFGGTQRMIRAVGKSKAMDLILTGRRMKADEAERSGLVSRVVPVERCLPEAVEAAQAIAALSSPSVALAKRAVDAADAFVALDEGLEFERQLFYDTFDLDDRREGMAAFCEKRKAAFTDSAVAHATSSAP
eukprot:CAMPEP_0205954912 /NCGR_PEP_ID=MMETSP1459-20131121/27814_1 /ASSEMBLY_ACC=CAM_ASM_001120 /TAXON_ID=41880 /ORGANISM="Pycnococcus provasolii, Strain RCC931" /LENGTH=301 /DNA_ID=CAMNT_0053327201 /DNA_START=1 /DNA_END=906 /DNA_ORIENTATION=+